MDNVSLAQEAQERSLESILIGQHPVALERFFLRNGPNAPIYISREEPSLVEITPAVKISKYDPDALNDRYKTLVDSRQMEGIRKNIPHELAGYESIIMSVALNILGLKKPMQDFKFQKSIENNGDIGYNEAVKRFIYNESVCYGKTIALNQKNPVNQGFCDPSHYKEMLGYVIQSLGENQTLKFINENINQKPPHTKDEFGAMPLFLKSNAFSWQVMTSMNDYCSNICTHELQCMKARNLPGRDISKIVPYY